MLRQHLPAADDLPIVREEDEGAVDVDGHVAPLGVAADPTAARNRDEADRLRAHLTFEDRL